MEALDCTTFNSSDLRILCEQNEMLRAALVASNQDVDIFYILWAASLVFFMHCGFAMLSAGAVRVKNTKNILMCILLDTCMCAIAWWFLGYGFAYGEDAGGFIGTSNFVGMSLGSEPGAYQDFFFQFAFAATAATIVSGAVAERASFEAYLSYSFFLSVWVYPVIVHWIWGGGWLTSGPDSLFGVGTIDFAGCGPVHMIGGVAGAIGSKLIGPRIGRFDSDGNARPIPGHSSPLAFLGTFILWLGWFGFNSGSALSIIGSGLVAERAAVNTLLSSATGGLAALFFSTAVNPGREWDIGAAMNGVLAGLVSITACCPVVESWAALVIGMIGGVQYILASRFVLNTLKIDDPLDATPVHMFTGMYGLIVTAFFAKTEFVREFNTAFVEAGDPKDFSGIFYGGNGSLLGANLIEILVVILWVGAFITPYFYFLKVKGWFRISEEAEHVGLDESSHGGTAYPELYNDLEKSSSRLLKGSSEGKDKHIQPVEHDEGVSENAAAGAMPVAEVAGNGVSMTPA